MGGSALGAQNNMANELRKILFSVAEVGAVLRSYAARTGKKMPSQSASSMQEESGGRIVVTFGSNEGARVAMPVKEMIAALLVFCHENDIPVPRGGKKALKLSEGSLHLMIKL